ncbi:MAG TPA: methyltransferase domain-containing protein [Acidimicrobiia bacterium]|nr:methyltransferase domain-containing protein [Acidimicrobiia bacterium]
MEERDPFARVDPSDDAVFYAVERRVVHLEPGAIEALRAFYATVLPAGAVVLDLMSSWRSHLPAGLGAVTGLGMNAAEMADNPQLDDVAVHDLNRQPRLPFDDESFDAVACAVSVQYLTRPLEVLADVRRVLRPGGPVVVSFSNRCFPTKAVAIWVASGSDGHRRLVQEYLERAGFASVTDVAVPSPDDPLFVVWGRRPDDDGSVPP